ncbi:MAG: TetR/AcrR family transcriptional regulator [Actinobacteria bacterium]|nr:TetR/AcrR family transcriptional regulator [Actinomycetota bacterium]
MSGVAIARRPESSDTAERILAAAKHALLESGYGALSTRGIADQAGVPLSQIHYHFGSKRQLVLALLEAENERRLARQAAMYAADQPLWKQWEQACDFLEDDVASGYVRVLQEMTAAGWSDDAVETAVRAYLRGWFRLLTGVTEEFANDVGGLGPFEPKEVATLVGVAFLGAETMILLGVSEEEMPNRSALRKVGALIRAIEERDGEER